MPVIGSITKSKKLYSNLPDDYLIVLTNEDRVSKINDILTLITGSSEILKYQKNLWKK